MKQNLKWRKSSLVLPCLSLLKPDSVFWTCCPAAPRADPIVLPCPQHVCGRECLRVLDSQRFVEDKFGSGPPAWSGSGATQGAHDKGCRNQHFVHSSVSHVQSLIFPRRQTRHFTNSAFPVQHALRLGRHLGSFRMGCLHKWEISLLSKGWTSPFLEARTGEFKSRDLLATALLRRWALVRWTFCVVPEELGWLPFLQSRGYLAASPALFAGGL